MISEWSIDIYFALTHIVILIRCLHLLKEQISSFPCPQAGAAPRGSGGRRGLGDGGDADVAVTGGVRDTAPREAEAEPQPLHGALAAAVEVLRAAAAAAVPSPPAATASPVAGGGSEEAKPEADAAADLAAINRALDAAGDATPF